MILRGSGRWLSWLRRGGVRNWAKVNYVICARSLNASTWKNNLWAHLLHACVQTFSWKFLGSAPISGFLPACLSATVSSTITPWDNFGPNIFLDPKFFRTQKFLDPTFWTQHFLDLKFFRTQNVYRPKSFWTQIFLDQNIFWTKIFLDPIFFLDLRLPLEARDTAFSNWTIKTQTLRNS